MIRTAKKVIVLLCWILLFAGMSGCLSGGAQEERISVAFQVVAFDKAPQKLQEIIEEHKKEEIKMTWEGDEGRYIIRGYGEQPTGGYSIRADAYEGLEQTEKAERDRETYRKLTEKQEDTPQA